MKIFQRILFWFIVILLLISAGIYVYMRTNGRPLIEKSLTEFLGRPFRVKSVDFFFPFTVSLNQVEVGDVIKAKNAAMLLHWPCVSGQKFVISRLHLIEPTLKLRRDKSSQIVLDDSPAVSPDKEQLPKNAAGDGSSPQKGKGIFGKKLFFKSVEIFKGELTLRDSSSAEEVVYAVRKLNLHARGISYPLEPENIEFKVSGEFISKNVAFSGSRLTGQGWVNFLKKDTETKIEIANSDKTQRLSAQLTSRNNDMSVKGQMHIGQLKDSKDTDFMTKSFGEFIVGMAQTVNLEADVGFSFQTKMDNFQMEKVALTGQIGYHGPEQGSSTKQTPGAVQKQPPGPLMQMHK